MATVNLDSTYTFNGEGKITSTTYPNAGTGGASYNYSYDSMYRLSGMTTDGCAQHERQGCDELGAEVRLPQWNGIRGTLDREGCEWDHKARPARSPAETSPPGVPVTSEELRRALVMRAIADDYEPAEVAIKDVQPWAHERDFVISQAEIIQQLHDIVAQGLASAYAAPKGYLEAVQLSYASGDLYFHLTEEGLRLIKQLLPKVWFESDLGP